MMLFSTFSNPDNSPSNIPVEYTLWRANHAGFVFSMYPDVPEYEGSKLKGVLTNAVELIPIPVFCASGVIL
jgi:hypothetical protein